MRTKRTMGIMVLLLGLLLSHDASAFYNSRTGRLLNRDPIDEKGGLNLYGFVGNNPIDGLDLIGLMRWAEVEQRLRNWNEFVKTFACCCDQPSALVATMKGTSSGRRVTETVTVTKSGCVDTVAVLEYLWWDCFNAQSEYNNDSSPGKPQGRQAWQEYGWHSGSATDTHSATGSAGGIWDLSDSNHWNWQAVVIYSYCRPNGRYGAKLAFSDAEEWTWDDKRKSWGNPHDGHY